MANGIEVLSPVGSFEALIAAVRSGADAVYFGAKDFSARRNAQNFSQGEMRQAIEYCHIRGVKAYLTLNIMIKDNELYDALQTAKEAYLSGIDAFILADIGLARMIKAAFPDVELHASTQMSVSSPSALPILKQMGFCRVVAAREMRRDELSVFCEKAKQLDMEVEVFVHGALCMCVSGQCLMSSILGGRSGNRGLCAGPCRLPFNVEGSKGYDLSLKDLSLYEHIAELCEMGAASLKIEGRMKRPEYIAAATAACRAATDNGEVPADLALLLKNVFSRSGFTDGYFTGHTGPDMFGVRTDDDIDASKQTLSSIHDIYRTERQSVAVSIKAEIKKGRAIKLSFSDGENKVFATGDQPQIAKNAQATAESIKERLEKLGSTPYYSINTEVDIDDGLFVSASSINNLRRELCERLNFKRGTVLPRRILDVPKLEFSSENTQPQKIIARFAKTEQIPENANDLAAVILPIDECLKQELNIPCEIIAQMPRYISDEDIVKRQLYKLKDKGIESLCCGNLASIKLAKDAGFNILGDIGLNVCNEQSLDQVWKMGAQRVLLSSEISLSSAVKIKSDAQKGIFAYGRLPLMVFKNCPLRNGRDCKDCDKRGEIIDRKNTSFPISCLGSYCELLNSKPLYLADRISETKGIDFLLLYFSVEGRQECSKVIHAYKNQNNSFESNDYTRGLYYRNLL